MRTFADLSIKGKLLWMSMAASISVLILASVAFITYDLITLRKSMANELSIKAEIIAINAVSAVIFNDQDSATDTLGALRATPGIVSAGIYDQKGHLFAQYITEKSPSLPGVLPEKAKGSRLQDGYLLLFKPIISIRSQMLGTIYIISNLEELRNRVQYYIEIVVLVLFISVLLALLISAKLQRKISQPILHLADTAKVISKDKDYSVRAVKESKDEVGFLVETFNEMLMQIQERDAELQKARDGLEEQVIERTSQLEAANKEIEAFAYSVSHDLRAPLRGIDGFSQVLLEDYNEKLDAQGKDYLQRIRAASQRMGALIEDMLKLSRLSRSEIKYEEVDLSKMAYEIAKGLQDQSPERKAEFVIEEGLIVKGDTVLLRAVLENLIGNAWKFTVHQPSARIEFGLTRYNIESAYFVRDNGAGFDMAYKDKLFAPFQRLHTEKEFSGTGVGLATVQRSIHRHGGRVWAEGEVGKGATFYFTI